MGSTGYLTCGICWMCGKCYPRKDVCPQCGGLIDLDGEYCPECGRAIGEEDRHQARERFKAAKKAEADQTFCNPVADRPTAPRTPIPTLRKP